MTGVRLATRLGSPLTPPPSLLHQVGHMRTNKACPLYQGPGGPQPSSNVSLTEQEDEEDSCRLDVPDDEELINVDGTKIKLSGKVIKVSPGDGREMEG